MLSQETGRIVETLTAVFLTVLVGYILKTRRLPAPEFWPGAEHITYHLLLPALLFSSIISAHVDPDRLRGLIVPFITPFLLAGGMLFLFRHRLAQGYPAFTSIFQGTIRFNSYVGFSIALSMYGTEGVAMAAMFISVVIPVVNVMTVAVLAGASGSSGVVSVFRHLIRNPLIIACVAALFIKHLDIRFPGVLLEFLTIVGRASLPLGLMAVGAALGFQRGSAEARTLSMVSFNRLLLMPLLMFFTCHIFAVTGLARSIAVLFAALPGSPAAYVLARQMGGDFRLMANLTTVQILVSFITLPLVLALEVFLR